MFNRRTTFIVGAGASCELDLPDGTKLKDKIISLLATTDARHQVFSDERFGSVVAEYANRQGGVNGWPQVMQEVHAAAAVIRRGLPMALSIDNFLHTHQSDPMIVALGKLAIVTVMLREEQSSALMGGSWVASYTNMRIPSRVRLDQERVGDSWYIPFIQALFAGAVKEDIAAAFGKVSFVVFNYDRCLEAALHEAVQQYFAVDEGTATAAMADLLVLHPYGSLGDLPWQAADPSSAVPFGGSDGLNLWSIADRIRTFTESVDSAEGQHIRGVIESAEQLVFLGFGFLAQNVSLIKPFTELNHIRTALSTAYGMLHHDQEALRTIIGQFVSTPRETILEAGSCRDLFDHNRLRLAYS